MDQSFWARGATTPGLNFDLTNILSHAYDADPVTGMYNAVPPPYAKPVNSLLLPLDSVITPTVIFWGSYGIFVFAGGTSGSIHVQALLEGWRDPNSGPDISYGACPAFARAARQILAAKDPEFWLSAANIYLVGHSYGGAIMQALSLVLSNNPPNVRGIWSYGSPRPGTQYFANRMDLLQNTRWWTQEDPVRWIPPHQEEASLLGNFGDVDLVRGMNRQVQTPIGFSIDALGVTNAGVGDPGPLSAVSLSVSNWCTDTNGFRSVNHAVTEYRKRFQYAMPLKPDGPARPAMQPLPPTGPIRPREIADAEEAAVPAINAAIADPTSGLNQETRQLPPPDPALRFKRRRDGRIWVVRYGDAVVDVGPGKRRAGRLARSYNRLVR